MLPAPTTIFPPLANPQMITARPIVDAHPPMQQPQGFIPPPSQQISGEIPSVSGYRQHAVKFENALEFLDQVKIQFKNNPTVYNSFLEIMKDFKTQAIDTPGVIARVTQLFAGHPQLILGFNNFLPPGYKIGYDEPTGTTMILNPPPIIASEISPSQQPSVTSPSQPPPRPRSDMMSPPGHVDPESFNQMPHPGNNDFNQQLGKQQHELTHARNYVKKIKIRFTPQPHIYKAFLEILHTYHKEQHTIRDVYNQVAKLFHTHPDLLEEFTQFHPDPTQAADMNQSINLARAEAAYSSPSSKHQSSSSSSSRSSQNRGRVKGTRSRRQAKSGSSHSPHGSLSGLPPSGIPPIGSPILGSPTIPGMAYPPLGGIPPVHSGSGPLSSSGSHSLSNKSNSPERLRKRQRSHEKSLGTSISNYDEHEFFFSRMKQRLKNQPIYSEFLKLLHLYNEDIINKAQMMALLKDLFIDHPDLVDRFRQYISYEDLTDLPADPEMLPTPSPWSEIDFTQCKRLGPSYRALPKVNQNVRCSGRTPLAASVLNDIWVSFPTGTEDGFKSTRKNQYEEILFKVEDDRYELDLVIELNTTAIRTLDAINRRINALRREEVRTFRINEGELDALHIRAIERIYGDKSSEIIEGLFSNPVVAIPVILRRLRAKDQLWQQARNEWNKVWRETDERNYYKSLDHQSQFFKQSEKKILSAKTLISEIKQIMQDSPALVSHRQPPHLSIPIPSFSIASDAVELLESAINTHHFNKADRVKLLNFMRQFILPFFFAKPGKSVDSPSSFISPSPEKPLADDIPSNLDDATEETSDDAPVEATIETITETIPLPVPEPSDFAEDPVQKPSHDLEMTMTDSSIPIELTEPSSSSSSSSSSSTSSSVDPNSVANSRNIFFGNSSFYVFFRLFAFLLQRLHTARSLAERNTELSRTQPSNPVERMLFPGKTQRSQLETSDRYASFLSKTLALLQGEVDQARFEDHCRMLLGISSFVLFTLDKLILQILKHIQLMLGDELSAQLLALHGQEDRHINGFMESVYHSNAFQILGADQRCFRIEAIRQGSFGRLQFLLLQSNQEPKFVPLTATKQSWTEYVETYLTDPPADDHANVDDATPRNVFLHRNSRRASKNAQRLTSAVVHNGLECKVCLSTYRLFYVENTEDYFYIPGSLSRAKSFQSNPGRTNKFRNWVQSHIDNSSIPASSLPFSFDSLNQ